MSLTPLEAYNRENHHNLHPEEYQHIYSDNDFYGPNVSRGATYWLKESMDRTSRGCQLYKTGSPWTGIGHILIARIESAVNVAFFSISLIPSSLIGICFFTAVPIMVVLNLASRLPGISSFKSIQDFTTETTDAIKRTARVYIIAIPVILMFSTAACINTFIPLNKENYLFAGIDYLVAPLGELVTVEMVVPGKGSATGTTTKHLSPLVSAEEYLRFFSLKNTIKQLIVSKLVHHRHFTVYH